MLFIPVDDLNGYGTARLDKAFHIGGDEPSCSDVSEEPSFAELRKQMAAILAEDRT